MNTSAGCNEREVEQLVDHRRVALERRPDEHRHVAAAVQHDVAQGDPVGGDQPTGAPGDLHGERLGVAGAEGVDDAARLQRLDDQLAGGVEGTVLGLPGQAFETRSRPP